MILYVLVILLLLYIIASTSKEGFENQSENEKTFIDDHIYDNFYSKLYDHIWNMKPFYIINIELMKPYFSSTNNFLSFDSKTGDMLQLLSNNMKVAGLENSKDMVHISNKKYPSIPFVHVSCNPSIFKNNLFTHIYCPLFSINTKDIDSFYECVDKWLVPKGYLFITTYSDNFSISKFLLPNSIVNYDIKINNEKLIEKIKFNNKKRTNIQYLKHKTFDYYQLIDIIEIPNYSCFLNVYQKNKNY
jgi:hypothetical protein